MVGTLGKALLRWGVVADDSAGEALPETPPAVFLRLLARAGYDIPASVLDRDVTLAWTYTPELVPVFAQIYRDTDANWSAYETCEELVDLEDNFQLWRFRHLKTVERIIGYKRGTGGSAGVAYLVKALEQSFFPELLSLRTSI